MTTAERCARLAARELAGGDRTAAADLTRGAEWTVVRRLVAPLAGGEERYWAFVEEELRR